MERRFFLKFVMAGVGVGLVNPVELLSDEEQENEDGFKNINAKMLRLRIRKDIIKILQRFEFEPNNFSTRKAIAAMIADYLEHLNVIFVINKDYYAVVHESNAVDVSVNMIRKPSQVHIKTQVSKENYDIFCFISNGECK